MILNREYHLHLSLSRFYPLILGAMAFALMISALIPFEVVLIPAIAASPEKWKRHCFASVIGSAIGATALAAIFLYFGWPLITHLFPDLVESRGWLWPRDWIMNYGAIALMILAALPIAQAPALILAGLFHVPLLHVFAAFLIGKGVKYSVISLLVVRGEKKYLPMIKNHLPKNHKT